MKRFTAKLFTLFVLSMFMTAGLPTQTSAAAELPSQKKPDLRVAGVKIHTSCKMLVTFENAGPGGIGDLFYSTDKSKAVRITYRVSFYPNGSGIYYARLCDIDKNKVLKNPGGKVEALFSWPFEKLKVYEVKIDIDNRLDESNENNNIFIKREIVCPYSRSRKKP